MASAPDGWSRWVARPAPLLGQPGGEGLTPHFPALIALVHLFSCLTARVDSGLEPLCGPLLP